MYSTTKTNNVFLPTAVIKIKSTTDNVIQYRALNDNPSQSTLNKEKKCLELIILPIFSTHYKLVGTNGISEDTCLN